MKSEILLTLIKEVVKNEVKQQVKEEVAKLIKSGAVTINKQRPQQQSTPSLKDLTEVNTTPKKESMIPRLERPKQTNRVLSKDPMINEILNSTTPFTAKHRAEGGMPVMDGGSILDALQPQRSMEEDWETMDFTGQMPQQASIPNPEGAEAVVKALTRDYSELVKRFK
jgi:hypothetical protein